MKIPKPLDVARAIANHECPVPSPVDLVLLGKAVRAAIARGLIKENHGCFDDWGGYSVTDAGRVRLGTDSAISKDGGR